MIANAKQYKITKAQAEKFREAIEQARTAPLPHGQTPEHRRVAIAGLRAQLRDLERELADYDATAGGGQGRVFEARLPDIGTLLIQARIARKLTQAALAERLGMKTQQIQRYEATGYRLAALNRLVDVAQALQVSVNASMSVIDVPVLTKRSRATAAK